LYYYHTIGATYKSSAEKFGVSEASVGRILRCFRETGHHVRKQQPKARKHKVDSEWLHANVREFPDARLIDRARWFGCDRQIKVSVSAVRNAMAANKYSYKRKTIFAKERDSDRVKALRAEFQLLQKTMDPARIVFIDESGWRPGTTTRSGWAPVGKKAVGFQKHWEFRPLTMIGAMRETGMPIIINIQSSTTSEVFRTFVKEILVPTLCPGDTVVMDNLSSHKDKQAITAIEAVPASVAFLPPYSPDFNPIEKLWGKPRG